MIRRAVVIAILVAVTVAPASAQERVTVGTQRTIDNGALFLAALRGYFKAEGIDVNMRAYASAPQAAQALAAGRLDVAVIAFSPEAFDLAGKGLIKIVAGQVREWSGYEGNQVVASNDAYARGVHDFADLSAKVVAIDALGSPLHYQLGEIAHIKGFALAGVTLKPLQKPVAIQNALHKGLVAAALLPAQYAREMLMANDAKLIGWCSQLAQPQLGAAFATAKMIETRRATVAKFVRAYARGAADYAAALLRHDRFGKRIVDAKTHAAAAAIARYVYPGNEGGAAVVEANAYFIDAKARVDADGIAHQIDWYKAQGLIGKDADAQRAVDMSFTGAQ